MSALVKPMSKERLSETLAFRVTSGVYERTKDIAKKTRRELADVERALYERGLAAYERDGELFEPEEDYGTSDNAERITPHPKPSVKMETVEGRRSPRRGRKTGNDKR